MTKYPFALVALLALAACTAPPLPLEKELAGESAIERRQVLLEECKSEARQRVFRKPLSVHYTQDFSARNRLGNLCDAIAARMRDRAAGNKAALMQSCRREADNPPVKDPGRIERMNEACNAMEREMPR